MTVSTRVSGRSLHAHVAVVDDPAAYRRRTRPPLLVALREPSKHWPRGRRPPDAFRRQRSAGDRAALDLTVCGHGTSQCTRGRRAAASRTCTSTRRVSALKRWKRPRTRPAEELRTARDRRLPERWLELIRMSDGTNGHAAFLRARDAGEHHPLPQIGCYSIRPSPQAVGRRPRTQSDGTVAGRLLKRVQLPGQRRPAAEHACGDGRTARAAYLRARDAGGEHHPAAADRLLRSSTVARVLHPGSLLAAYREFEDRVGLLTDGRGAKTASIERFVRNRLSDEFTIADVREAALGASDSLIGKVLARLRDEGVIEPLGTGRSARWRRR